MLSSYAASSAVLNISGMESWRVDYANRFGFAGDGAWEDGVSWDNQPRIQAEGMLMNRALLTTGGKSKSPQGWHRAKTHDYRRAHTLQDLRTFAMFAQLPEYSNAIWEVARDIVKDVYGPGVVELLDRDAGVARTGWLVAMMDGCFHTIPWHSPRFLCRLGLNSLRKRRGVWAVNSASSALWGVLITVWESGRRSEGQRVGTGMMSTKLSVSSIRWRGCLGSIRHNLIRSRAIGKATSFGDNSRLGTRQRSDRSCD